LFLVGATGDAVGDSRPVRISLVINTLNEERNIAACIRSVGDFADEVVVVDMHSEDQTREIAAGMGAEVILHKREPYVEKARRFAVEQARGEWILLLDADERAPQPLLDELQAWMQDENVNVVQLRMTQLFMGRLLRHGAYSAATLFRFFRRDKYLAVAPQDSEATIHTGRPIGLATMPGQVVAKQPYIHVAYPTLASYSRKWLEGYAFYEAEGWYKKGVGPSPFRLIFSPVIAFVGSYLYRLGFLDGVEGFMSSILWAMSRFLVQAHLYDFAANRRDNSPWAGIVALPKTRGKDIEGRLSRHARDRPL
jgi:glycosyltransferase involved in cell wall biosynthesis